MLNTLLRLTFLFLLVIGCAGLFWFSPPNAPATLPALLALIIYGPLLLVGLAARRLHPRSLTWLCFLLLFYFCGYVVQAFNPPPVRTLAVVEISLTVVLFVLCMVVIRRGSRAD